MIEYENGHKAKLTEDERHILSGIESVLNYDICAPFGCPRGGCEVCPLNAVVDAHEKFLEQMNKLTTGV